MNEETQPTKQDRAATCWAVLDRLKPANAQALIVAELREDDSDMMTDYFAAHTTRTVAIGWRTGSREDFKQLRKAAGRFEFTAHLGPDCDHYTVRSAWAADNFTGAAMGYRFRKGEYYVHGALHGHTFTTRAAAEKAIAEAEPLGTCDGVPLEYVIGKESIEHRDNYSMGGGNYLGLSKYSGWIVRSRDLKYAGYRNDVFETEYLEVIMAKPATEPPILEEPLRKWADAVFDFLEANVTISENEEKDGIEIRFAKKPASDVLDRMKSNGWRWSRFGACWYAKRTERARVFAQQLAGGAA